MRHRLYSPKNAYLSSLWWPPFVRYQEAVTMAANFRKVYKNFPTANRLFEHKIDAAKDRLDIDTAVHLKRQNRLDKP